MELAISNMNLALVRQSASIAVTDMAMDLQTQVADNMLWDMAAIQPVAFIAPGGMDIRI